MKQLSSLIFLCALMLVPAAFVSADTATTTAACPVFARDLSFGAVDTAAVKDVTALQVYLTNAGFLATSTANGTFGPKTFAAVQAFQKKNGLNAVGFFGPLTRARVQAMGCTVAAPAPVAENKEITFMGFETPEKLKSGETGTWKVQFNPGAIALDDITYKAMWGDEATTTGPVIVTDGFGTSTIAFFSHLYKKSGTYRTTLIVTPPDGEPLRILSSEHVKTR